MEAYGALDELTSTLGVCICYIDNNEEARFVENIQKDLYIIMGFLAHAPTNLKNQINKIDLIEKKIDLLTDKLPSLKNFIIPGGSLASCWAHLARASCRKAERVVVSHFQKETMLKNKDALAICKYLNRLSDLLFTYARSFNVQNEKILKI